MISNSVRRRPGKGLLSATVLGMVVLAMILFSLLPGNRAHAVETDTYTVTALPEVKICAVVSLNGKMLGMVESLESAYKVVALATEYLGVTGCESSVIGELQIQSGLCAQSNCMTAKELFRKLTVSEPLPVESIAFSEGTRSVPYETVVVEDPGMYEGESGVVRQGINGEEVVVIETRYVNGRLESSKETSCVVVKQPVNRVERVGLMPNPEWWPSGAFIQPAQGTITSEFGKRRYERHTGIDIANYAGTEVVAADGGTVLFAGWLGNYGRYVVLDHNGIYTCYAHNSKLLVSKGDHVVQGQQIAEMGSTGRSTGSHCHFEMHNGTDFIQPRDYIEFVSTERSR